MQVVSLTLSKKLKKLGVKKESLFQWSPNELEKGYHVEASLSLSSYIAEKPNSPAYTVAELGGMLPSMTISYHMPVGEWTCKVMENISEVTMEMTEADARAKMLIRLIKKKIIDPKKL